MEQMNEEPMIINFSSVSNDEVEMENPVPAINLSIDIGAVNANPNTHSVTPPLETPTFSYCTVPKFALDLDTIKSSNAYIQPSFAQPPSRPQSSLFLDMDRFSRPNSQNSYHPFAEELDWDNISIKRKLSTPRAMPNLKRMTTFENREFTDSSSFCVNFSNPLINATNSNYFQHNQASQISQPPVVLLKSEYADPCLFHNDQTGLQLFVIYDNVGNGIAADVLQMESRLNVGFTFALKKFKKPVRSAKQEQMLLKEFAILNELNSLSCPYIPAFHLVWKEDSIMYAVMEYAEFGTLKDLMDHHIEKSFEITIPYIWHAVNNVCSALQFIHNQGLVHLDIKSANLLIFEGGIIKIGDFGLATKAGTSDEEHEGDTRYLPLELLNTNERQYSADIFSFGIVLYELIQICASQGLKENNVLPSDGTLWQKLRSGDFMLPDNVPLSMALLVRAMMNPSPASRPSASDILTLPEVSLIEKDPSLYADEWKDICFVQPRSMNRTASYDPATMRI